MNLKHVLIASLFIISAVAHAEAVDQDGVLKDAQGKVILKNQADAIKACAKQGMHLPTIRELAKLSQSAGITLKEPSEVSEGEIRIGAMKPISAVNPNRKTVRFYYSNDNYTRPAGDLGAYRFWSSSVPSYSSDYGYVLSGTSGDVYGYARYGGSDAVRCVVGQ